MKINLGKRLVDKRIEERAAYAFSKREVFRPACREELCVPVVLD